MLACTACIHACRSFSDSACSMQLLQIQHSLEWHKAPGCQRGCLTDHWRNLGRPTLTLWGKPPRNRTSSRYPHRVWQNTISDPPPPRSGNPATAPLTVQIRHLLQHSCVCQKYATNVIYCDLSKELHLELLLVDQLAVLYWKPSPSNRNKTQDYTSIFIWPISSHFHLPVPGLESVARPLEEVPLHHHAIGCIYIEFQLGIIIRKILMEKRKGAE